MTEAPVLIRNIFAYFIRDFTSNKQMNQSMLTKLTQIKFYEESFHLVTSVE